MIAPEFSRLERLDTIGDRPRDVTIVATEAERQALAQRFELIGIDRLEARFTLRADAGGVMADGRVSADVVQACSASGVPLRATVDEAVSLRFIAEMGGPTAKWEEELELSPDALDTLPIENGAIDLGEAAAETMALALDPFPRAPDADEALAAAGVTGEGPAGPFAALAGLKHKLGE